MTHSASEANYTRYGTSESRAVVIREGGAAAVVAGLAALVLVAGCAGAGRGEPGLWNPLSVP